VPERDGLPAKVWPACDAFALMANLRGVASHSRRILAIEVTLWCGLRSARNDSEDIPP